MADTPRCRDCANLGYPDHETGRTILPATQEYRKYGFVTLNPQAGAYHYPSPACMEGQSFINNVESAKPAAGEKQAQSRNVKQIEVINICPMFTKWVEQRK